jgi:hypothetical protein
MSRLVRLGVILILLIVASLLVAQIIGLGRDAADPRSGDFLTWSGGDAATREALVTVQRDTCPGAPFILPTDGFIGLLYADPRGPYSAANPHQGIDIFSNAEPGVMPVYAAYSGYIRREASWRSALIQRVPDDPLQPGRQIWLYYAHMADRDGNSFIVDAFPPGTSEIWVEQGTLLGYTGDYNGDSLRDIWVHIHFSIVLDDSTGRYRNELEFANTLDPSPYLGLALNYACGDGASVCTSNPTCGT